VQPSVAGNYRIGAPETIRTSDLNIRSVALYPTELRAREINLLYPRSCVNSFESNRASLKSDESAAAI
jgi:hypothetical protein